MNTAQILTEAAVVAGTVVSVPYWRAARKWVRHWLRPTVVYSHRYGDVPGLGRLRGRVTYVGMSNRPDLRARQHEAGAWWHPLTDPRLYSHRRYRTRVQAAVVERWTIRLRSPVGNTQHNRRYASQAGLRAELRIRAGSLRTPGVPR